MLRRPSPSRRSNRRPVLASIAGLVAVLAVVLAACSNSATNAPALTDPKDILTHSILSLKDVKTVQLTGTFNGAISSGQTGNIDLSSGTMAGAADIPNKKAKFNLSLPSLLSTAIDAILIDQTGYYKVSGPLAGALGATADKYTKVDLASPSGSPAGSGNPDVTDVNSLTQQIQDGLNKLPTPPVKQPDEKCGDQDCYHVTVTVTSADMQKLDPTSSVNADITLDVWSRKSDYRPAKLAVSVTSPQIGTVGATIDLTYDQAVTIDAPPADQVVTK